MMPTTMVSLIWAMDENGLIGRDNRLPWHLPADLAWFKRQTLGKPILMGRKTYESIGRPLPGRRNLVLSSRQDLKLEGCTVVHSIEQARKLALPAPELMVIGGAEVYRQALPQAQRLYITEIHAAFDGDTWFPSFDRNNWREIWHEHHEADERNRWPYSFVILERAG